MAGGHLPRKGQCHPFAIPHNLPHVEAKRKEKKEKNLMSRLSGMNF